MFDPFSARNKECYSAFFFTGWDLADHGGGRPSQEDLLWLAWTTCITREQRIWLAHGLLAGFDARARQLGLED